MLSYEAVEQSVKALFASRLKRTTKDDVQVWTDLILRKQYTPDVLEKTFDKFMEDSTIELTIPNFFRVASDYVKYIPAPKIDCPYCNGLNWVYSTLYFANDGTFINLNYALRCYHNNNPKSDSLKMELNEKTHNKTQAKDGYFLVFKDVVERDSYLEKVFANGKKDIR